MTGWLGQTEGTIDYCSAVRCAGISGRRLGEISIVDAILPVGPIPANFAHDPND